MAVIAGRVVHRGDKLYNTFTHSWCTVVEVLRDSGYLVVEFIHNGMPSRVRAYNGEINGVRSLYWHEPLQLDLPMQDISLVQNMLDTLIELGIAYGKQVRV